MERNGVSILMFTQIESIRLFRKFYDGSIGERYKVVQEDLVRALPVACKFQSSWRRGQIVDFTLGNDCTIQVTRVPYLSVLSVSLSVLISLLAFR